MKLDIGSWVQTITEEKQTWGAHIAYMRSFIGRRKRKGEIEKNCIVGREREGGRRKGRGQANRKEERE